MEKTHPMFLIAAGSVTLASLAAVAHFAGLLPGRAGDPPPAHPPAQVASAQGTLPSAPPPAVLRQESQSAPATLQTEAAPPVAKAAPATKANPSAADKAASKARSPEPVRVAPPPVEAARHDGLRRVANDPGIDVIPAKRPTSPIATTPPPPVAPPPVCRECGTVDSVREVARTADASGVGAIAGGVLGGVLGNQVGRGSGRDAATILGAIGGAVGGHHIEKNVRTQKQYQVGVRFDDGSYRTYTLNTAQWRTGDRVRLTDGYLAGL